MRARERALNCALRERNRCLATIISHRKVECKFARRSFSISFCLGQRFMTPGWIVNEALGDSLLAALSTFSGKSALWSARSERRKRMSVGRSIIGMRGCVCTTCALRSFSIRFSVLRINNNERKTKESRKISSRNRGKVCCVLSFRFSEKASGGENYFSLPRQAQPSRDINLHFQLNFTVALDWLRIHLTTHFGLDPRSSVRCQSSPAAHFAFYGDDYGNSAALKSSRVITTSP